MNNKKAKSNNGKKPNKTGAKPSFNKNGKGKQGVAKQKLVKPKLNLPRGWFYMSEKKIDAQQLEQCLKASEYDVELWIDAGVVEVALGEKASMDFETFEVPFEDEFSDAFMEQNGLKSAFYASFPDEVYEQVKGLVEVLRNEFGGGLYGDTDDFTPML